MLTDVIQVLHIMFIRVFIAGLVIGAFSASAIAQSAETADSSITGQGKKLEPTKESCKTFVQDFYAWYLPMKRDSAKQYPLDIALKDRRPFSARLIKGLNDVDEVATRDQDPGLDFDPILNTQDAGNPGDPGYIVRDSKVERGVCRIDIYRPRYGGGFEKAVVPELDFDHGRWIFVNFHYPGSHSPQWENLLSAIKAYLTWSAEMHKKAN